MSQAPSDRFVGDGARKHRPRLVERICRKIVAIDADYDGAHVLAGDYPRRNGPDTTSDDVLEGRADMRAVIASALFIMALLFWGMMLIGIDSVQGHGGSGIQHGSQQQSRPGTKDSGCAASVAATFVGGKW